MPKRGWSRWGACAAAVAVCAVASGEASARVIYVRAGANGAATGASWGDAYPDLQAALGAAGVGDQLWVAAGTYRPASAGGDRHAHFALRPGVAMYGGFAGTETLLAQRDPEANETILSGDLAGDDAAPPGFGNKGDNVYQVVVAIGGAIDASTVLDGFTITAGYADGVGLGPTPASMDQGSGLNVYDASPRVVHCVFRGNWAVNHGTLNDHGNCTLVGCTFRDNYANDHGAGLYVHHEAMTTATDCTFINNSTPLDGGGAYLSGMHMGGPTLTGCTFTGNSANRGGGVYVALNGVGTLQNCTFTGNNGILGGGGVYSDFGMPVVTGCTFRQNTAGLGVDGGTGGGGGSGGAGVWTSGDGALVQGCTFDRNSASFGAGVYSKDGGNPRVEGCTFTQNTATEGGGVYALVTDAVVIGCTFSGNSAAGGTFSVGGGASAYFASSVFTGCVFVGNTGALGAGGLYTEGESVVVDRCEFRGNAAVGGDNCCGSNGWGGGMLIGYSSAARVTGCAFVGNTADLGGGVFAISLSTPAIVNCTMAGNAAREGAAVYGFSGSAASLTNCVVWGNTGVGGTTPAVQIVDQDGAGGGTVVSYSDVQGGWSGAGVGNLAARPRFVDAAGGDVRVKGASPCIDAGNTGAVPAGATVDLAGNPRVLDDAGMPNRGVAGSGGGVVDMGAYEFQGRSCRADWDGNGAVQPADVAAFVGDWFAGLTSGDLAGDFDGDGVLGPADIAAMVNWWFGAVAGAC